MVGPIWFLFTGPEIPGGAPASRGKDRNTTKTCGARKQTITHGRQIMTKSSRGCHRTYIKFDGDRQIVRNTDVSMEHVMTRWC